jgi:hypothetical protein
VAARREATRTARPDATVRRTRMRSHSPLVRWLAGVLFALVLGMLAATRTAQAQRPPAPAPDIVRGATLALPALPGDHRVERRGPVLWSWPAQATDEARALQAVWDDAWPRIRDELGGELPEEATIRLARNPDELRALAPVDAPPPAYATGVTYPDLGLILLSFAAPETWERPAMDKVLAHELSHLALHRAAPDAPLPRWFVEGLAVQQSGEHSIARVQTLAEAVVGGSLLPLSELSRRFPEHTHAVSLAYAQSASVVGYLRGDASKERKFARLLRELRRGATFSGALREAYYVSLADLEREWRADVSDRFTALPLLVTGSGIWALALVLTVAAWFRRRRKRRETLARWAAEEEALRAAAVARARLEALQARRWAEALALTEARAVLPERSDPELPTVHHDGRDHTVH